MGTDGTPTEAEVAELSDLLRSAMKRLSERTARVLTLRIGLCGEDPQTLAQIGEGLGVSRERIRQIQEKATRQLCARGAHEPRGGVEPSRERRLRVWLVEHIRPAEDGCLERTIALADSMFDPRAAGLGAFFLLRLAGIKKADALKWMPRRGFRAMRQPKLRARPQSDLNTRVLQHVAWPAAGVDAVTIPHGGRAREVDEMGRGMAGEFDSAKLRRAVAYESRAELAFFLLLESSPSVIAYQEQPFEIPYPFAGVQRHYYPDVFFVLNDGRAVVAEIKTRVDFGLIRDLVKWAALWEYCRQRGYGLYIGDARNSFQSHARRSYPEALEARVLAELANGAIGWPRYRELLMESGIKAAQPVPVVLRHRLEWRLRPFELRASGSYASTLDSLYAALLSDSIELASASSIDMEGREEA